MHGESIVTLHELWSKGLQVWTWSTVELTGHDHWWNSPQFKLHLIRLVGTLDNLHRVPVRPRLTLLGKARDLCWDHHSPSLSPVLQCTHKTPRVYDNIIFIPLPWWRWCHHANKHAHTCTYTYTKVTCVQVYLWAASSWSFSFSFALRFLIVLELCSCWMDSFSPAHTYMQHTCNREH